MRTDLFDYELPADLIAQTPEPRGTSRLLVLHRDTGQIEHRRFSDIFEFIHPGDTLVVNDTRVTARRLQAIRETGQPAEVLLIRPIGETAWEALVRPGRALRPGKTLILQGGPPETPSQRVYVTASTPSGGRILETDSRAVRDSLSSWGELPLPPYIHSALPPEDQERYQTVFADTSHGGSSAAPTAGLHFTQELLDRAIAVGIGIARITLNIGIDTFRPVRSEAIEKHAIHGETVLVTQDCAAQIYGTQGRIIAVGTTSVRALESAAQNTPFHTSHLPGRRIAPFFGETRLFIYPGYQFQAVDAILTNFHMPRSTLLMLISAFAGRENVLRAYQEAIQAQYRFYSFGDAMLMI